MAIEIPSINLTAPKITCSLNDKLNTLNSKKDALKDSIKNLASIKINGPEDLTKLTSAFSSVQDRVESLKISLKDAIPIPPQVENFQTKMKELTNLAATAEGRVNAEIYKQVDDLKKKFAGSVPGLSTILKQSLQGGAQIDICSLPNVDLIPSSIPGLPAIPKVQPPAALVPTEPPPVVQPKPPTIVKKVEQKTSGVTKEKPVESASSLEEYTKLFREKFGGKYFNIQLKAQQKLYAAQKTIKGYVKRANAAGYEGGGFKAWENKFDDPDDGKYTEYLKLYNDYARKKADLHVVVKGAQSIEKTMFKEGLKTAAEYKARPSWPNRKFSYEYYDIENRKQTKILVTAEDEDIKLIEEVVDFVAANYDKWHPHYKLKENTDK